MPTPGVNDYTTSRFPEQVDPIDEPLGPSDTPVTERLRNVLVEVQTKLGSDQVGAGSVEDRLRDLEAQSPARSGFKAWSYDLVNAVNTALLVSGSIYVAKLYIPKAMTVSNLHVDVRAAINTPTANQNLAGLYSASGIRLGVTNDQGSAWGTQGLKTMALTTPVAVSPGFYFAAIISVATTPVSISRATGSTSSANGLLTPANFRFGLVATGQTALPASFEPGDLTATLFSLWFGLS